jgi:hypothetical protein
MLRTDLSFMDDSVPLLATAIHAGHHMPSELLDICGISEADRLREEDPHTDEIARLFPNNMVLRSSRFAVDLNRAPEKAIYLQPEDCWGLPARTRPVPESLLAKLRADYYAWYDLLRYEIERLLQMHPFIVVLDLHSFNHRRGGPDAPCDPQENNPDIIIGRSNLTEKHYQAAGALRELLDGAPYLGKALDCRLDVKFSGGNMSRWLNSRYPDRLICLAIEFKKTFMDEWSGEVDQTAFASLKQLFHSSVDSWLLTRYGIALPA